MAAWRKAGNLGPFRAKLLDGLRTRGYPEDFAERLFRQIEGFGEYGFPESQAASFALLAYSSAWLKCHAPADKRQQDHCDVSDVDTVNTRAPHLFEEHGRADYLVLLGHGVPARRGDGDFC